MVVYPRNHLAWLLSGVYASPNPVYHQDLLDYVSGLGSIMNLSWLLLGDFNQIVNNNEKQVVFQS